jgi:hypothetical protein
MDTTPSKKIQYRIEILSYSNALNWFWRVEDLLEGKDIWTPINDVINDRATQESNKESEDTKPTPLSEAIAAKASKAEWKRKNSKAKAIISGLISEGDINTVRTRELRYAGDIWLYLKAKYTRTTRGMLTATMGNFTRWKKNSAHTMEEAAQEIEAIADRVQQLGGPTLDSFLVKHQFLSGLPDEYESARQILESQDAKMGEIITRLMEIELRFKESKNNEREDDFALQARDWMKSATCFNCGKKGHIAKYCDHGKEDSSDEDEKSRKAAKSRRKKAKERAAMMQLFSSDSESAA